MPKPYIYLGITAASCFLTFVSPSWSRLHLIGIGLSTGTAYLLHNLDESRRRNQRLVDISDRYLILSKAHKSLEASIILKQAELANIQKLTTDELDAIASMRQQHLQNLNNQIEELSQLLDEQLAEIDQREEQSRQQLLAEIEQYRQAVEADLEAKRQQLGTIAQTDEEWLQQETERLTQALEEDKAAFLEKHQIECDRLVDRIEFLEQELGALQWQLRDYEQPQLPEGVEQDAIAARRCIEILHRLGVICDYRGSWLDKSYIYVKIRPRTGGIKQVTKWLDRLQIELSLAEKPTCELVPGAIQLYLRPRAFLPIEPEPLSRREAPRPMTELHPEVPDTEAIATLNASYLRDFVEPEVKHSINGAISQLEIDWFNYLWNFHEPRPIRNQKAIIYRIWGKKSGDGAGFITARGRLHRVARILSIELRRKSE